MVNGKNQDNKSTVRAVERSLDILACFIDSTELGLTEIAKRISLHKSTVYRLVNTLEQKGFLIKNSETEKYRLGFRIWELSSNLTGIDDPATLFLPEMKHLRDTLGETISLYVRDGYERIRIQAVESNQPIRRVAPVGVRLPLSVGASSKILIAYEKNDVREKLFQELEFTISKKEFTKMINEIVKQGYATSFEEREVGAAAISAPIINHRGELIAALSVSGPLNRITDEKIKEIVPILIEAARRMGKMTK